MVLIIKKKRFQIPVFLYLKPQSAGHPALGPSFLCLFPLWNLLPGVHVTACVMWTTPIDWPVEESFQDLRGPTWDHGSEGFQL